MDAFFAAVEQLDDPALRGKPVIVGSPNARGVVAAASYEARKFGVRSAMPSSRAKRLCPDAIWVRGNFDRYRHFSKLVREILLDVTPEVQMASIDEAYLDVTPGAESDDDPVEVARQIQLRVDGLGLSCSIGVATGRTVAKIGSDCDKPHGITVVRPGEEAAFLSPLPLSAMPGIGPMSASRLGSFGLRTLGDVAALDDDTARALMGSHGPALALRARGIDARPVRERQPAKSISAERTFSADLTEAADVEAVLGALAEDVTTRVRAAGIAGRTVHVKARFSDFTTRTAQRTLPAPTDVADEVLPIARELLRTLWHPGVGLRLLGAGMSGFEGGAEQLDLLTAAADEVAEQRGRALAEGMDAVRTRFGPDAIVRGAAAGARKVRRREHAPMSERVDEDEAGGGDAGEEGDR